MSQNSAVYTSKGSSGTGLSFTQISKDGSSLLSTTGGNNSALNQTVGAVIKASPGRVCRITIVNAGTTGGTFTLNDCLTTGAASAANTIWAVAFNGTGVVAGASFDIQWPCLVGIVLSAVPTGGTPIVAISFI